MHTCTYSGPNRRAIQRTISHQAAIMLCVDRELGERIAPVVIEYDTSGYPVDSYYDLVASRWMFAQRLIAGEYVGIWEDETLPG